MVRWISVDDYLPPYDKTIMLWNGFKAVPGVLHHTDVYGHHFYGPYDHSTDSHDFPDVTHWLEIPQGPAIPSALKEGRK